MLISVLWIRYYCGIPSPSLSSWMLPTDAEAAGLCTYVGRCACTRGLHSVKRFFCGFSFKRVTNIKKICWERVPRARMTDCGAGISSRWDSTVGVMTSSAWTHVAQHNRDHSSQGKSGRGHVHGLCCVRCLPSAGCLVSNGQVRWTDSRPSTLPARVWHTVAANYTTCK